ncbi:hypothetical protein VTO73DRAFT_3854 [Trametes versicolor]
MNLFAYIPTILSTPLLKIPLLVSEAILNYITTTPPNPPPPPVQTKKYDGHGILTPIDDMHMKIISVLKWCTCGLIMMEAAAVIIQETPSLWQSHPSLAQVSTTVEDLSLRITPTFVVGSMLALAGGLNRLWCHRTLGRFFVWQLSLQDGHKLVTTGPYAIVRHPSYISWIVLQVGNIIMLSSAGSYCVEAGVWQSVWGKKCAVVMIGYFTPAAMILLNRMAKEDAVLREEFGSEWEAWSKQTPYQAIPYLY